LVFLAAGFFGYRYVVPVEEVTWNELKVPKGETAELLLPDGTRMYLNSGSRITYPSEFRGDSRRVFVEGEVFADVAKDSRHPFVIECGDVDVKVLGTRFNLKAYDDAECVEMLLMEGCVQMGVEVNSHTKQVTMHPGDMLQFDRSSGNMDLRNFNPDNYKGFYDNRSIHFFNLTLSDIASDLERLFGTKVVLLDESLARTRYFAWFTNNETLEQILASIDVDGRIKYVKRDGVIYISRR
ncbi:MAG: FecR family protein, partial [Candidatus Cryptobacteroides sp.]